MNGKEFTDTYFYRDGNRQAFLYAGKLLSSRQFEGKEKEYNIFQPGAKNKIIDTEGGIPAIVVRIRFMNAISKAGDNVARIFILLNQMLTEAAIKELYPEIWIGWHNTMARHEANKELDRIRKEKKDKIHRDCVAATTHITKRRAAFMSRLFT